MSLLGVAMLPSAARLYRRSVLAGLVVAKSYGTSSSRGFYCPAYTSSTCDQRCMTVLPAAENGSVYAGRGSADDVVLPLHEHAAIRTREARLQLAAARRSAPGQLGHVYTWPCGMHMGHRKLCRRRLAAARRAQTIAISIFDYRRLHLCNCN